MAYLIDGNNLLGRLAAHELKDRSGRDGLVVRLLAFQRVTRARIHLVFDGRSDEDRTVVPVNPKFMILYPEEGQSADDVIKDLVSRQTDRRRFFVQSVNGLAKMSVGVHAIVERLQLGIAPPLFHPLEEGVHPRPPDRPRRQQHREAQEEPSAVRQHDVGEHGVSRRGSAEQR